MELLFWRDVELKPPSAFRISISSLIATTFLVINCVQSLSAAPDASTIQTIPPTENDVKKLQCETLRNRYTASTCERKATSAPTSASDLEIPYYYSTALIWEASLLKFAQELHSNQPKDLQASTSSAIQSCLSGCARAKQCQDQVFEYFGMSSSFFSRLASFFNDKKKGSRRNESLAAALGENLYKSDAGELINRYTDIKICGELKAEAKKDQCDLLATAQK
jgi:hypothetical protein